MKIRRFKRLNEDDLQQQLTVAQPVQQQQPVATAPAEQTAPQQSAENQKMTAFLGDFQNKIASGDVYWALAYNLPEEIQKAVPEFKNGNPGADAGIKSWEAYKQNPSQQTFQTLIGELSKFGTQPAQQQPAAQPAAPAAAPQPAANNAAPAQPAPATQQQQPNVAQQAQPAPVQTAVNAQAQQESLMRSFGKRLQESLERELHDENIHNAIVENALNGHPNGWIG